MNPPPPVFSPHPRSEANLLINLKRATTKPGPSLASHLRAICPTFVGYGYTTAVVKFASFSEMILIYNETTTIKYYSTTKRCLNLL